MSIAKSEGLPSLLTAVLVCLAIAGCGRPTTPKTLRSGVVVGILDADAGDDGYFLDYCSRSPGAANIVREVLRPEVAEVLDAFSAEAATSSTITIWVHDCSWHIEWAGWQPVDVGGRGTEFSFIREYGKWKAIN